MRQQKAFQHALVFRVVKGAGGVDHHAAGTEHLRGFTEDIHLAVGTIRRGIGVPFVTRFGLAAEHALSRAGRIDQYAVKERRKARRKRIGQCADDNGVAHTHALHISGKNLSAAGNRFVADQQPLSAHQRGNLRAFAAGSGAQIQHALARLGVKHGDSGQRARLLHIKQTAFMERGKSGACIAFDEICALCPRNRRTKPLDGAGRRAVPDAGAG